MGQIQILVTMARRSKSKQVSRVLYLFFGGVGGDSYPLPDLTSFSILQLHLETKSIKCHLLLYVISFVFHLFPYIVLP